MRNRSVRVYLLVYLLGFVFNHHNVHSNRVVVDEENNHKNNSHHHHHHHNTSLHLHYNHSLRNVSSDDFRALAARTYAKIIPCLKRSWMSKDKKISDYQFPLDAQGNR